ncbi:hypothetical protein ACFLXU_02865 [Chloroflexota bacterium]
MTKLSASQYEQALQGAIDLRIREGTHQEVRWFGWMDNPKMKANGGPEWFEGMKSFLSFLKERQDAGLLKTMLFSDLVKLFCPEIF